MVWIVAGLPLAAVCAGIALVALARDPRGVDPGERVRRVAQVQQADLSADLAASKRALAAVLELDRGSGRIAVAFEPPHDGAWVLSLAHPADARLDRRIALARDGTRFVATTAPLDAGPRIATLESRDGTLRIAGRVDAGADVARLLPRVRE